MPPNSWPLGKSTGSAGPFEAGVLQKKSFCAKIKELWGREAIERLGLVSKSEHYLEYVAKSAKKLVEKEAWNGSGWGTIQRSSPTSGSKTPDFHIDEFGILQDKYQGFIEGEEHDAS